MQQGADGDDLGVVHDGLELPERAANSHDRTTWLKR